MIYIPRPETLEDRKLIRVHFTIVREMVRLKQLIKSLLNLYGIEYTDELKATNTHWSKRFINWFKTVQFQYFTQANALNILIKKA